MKKKTIFLVGSDTGGHVVPVFALAEDLLKYKEFRIVLIGVGTNIEKKFYTTLKDVEYKTIIAGKFQFRSFWKYFIAVIKSCIGFFQSVGLVIKYRPKVVFLKGNYSTVPVAFAARIFAIPIVAHESDAVIGKSNRLIKKFARKLFVSYPTDSFGSVDKSVEYSGPILREQYSKKSNSKLANGKLTILILGGSQGAHAINNLVFSTLKELASDYKIIHQTGAADFNNAETEKNKLDKELAKNYFPVAFINDNFNATQESDLIVSRASSSIFEFAAFEKPVILIPYPYASLDHQAANAKYFEKKDAAIVLNEREITPAILYSIISRTILSDKRKMELGKNLFKSVRFGGEKVVVDEIIKLARK